MLTLEPAFTGTAHRASEIARAEEILSVLLPHRRTLDTHQLPDRIAAAFPQQIRQIAPFLTTDSPILFAIPSFPCKSPHPDKVLGHLPDQAERLALTFLNGLCERITELHPPGATILICSDGRVFGDLIHVPDAHIDAYGRALREMIEQENLTHLRTFDLSDIFGDLSPDAQRERVHAEYAPGLEELRAQVKAEENTARLYRGITRFLLDDTVGFEGSRSALQRDCRARAYGVIQRSWAWGNLIAERYPMSVRLSIHPQPAGAAKFGIRLLDAPDAWMTPWHASVLSHPGGKWELLHRKDAAARGTLVERDGRPSHYLAD